MENNQPEKLDKKLFIKKALVNITIAMVFCFSPTFMTYGRMSVKPFLIILGFCIVLGSTMAFFAAKYDNRIMRIKRTRPKFWKIFLIFGILIVIAYLWLIIREGGKTDYYSALILGLFFIYYSYSGLPKIKELESVNTPSLKHSIDGWKWLDTSADACTYFAIIEKLWTDERIELLEKMDKQDKIDLLNTKDLAISDIEAKSEIIGTRVK